MVSNPLPASFLVLCKHWFYVQHPSLLSIEISVGIICLTSNQICSGTLFHYLRRHRHQHRFDLILSQLSTNNANFNFSSRRHHKMCRQRFTFWITNNNRNLTWWRRTATAAIKSRKINDWSYFVPTSIKTKGYNTTFTYTAADFYVIK